MYKKEFGGRIQLKSAPADTPSTSTTPKDQYLHLCTESHVWAVRQVSTSNSVHVLAPASVLSLNNSNGPSLASPGVAAFAQPTSTLELLPAPFTDAEIDAAIHRLLAIHPAPGQSTGSDTPDHSISAKELDASLPYPHFAVAQAKRRCFVFESHSQVYVPSPHLLLAAWQEFADYAAIRKIKLATFDLIQLGEVLSQIAMDEGPLLPAVVQAIAAEFLDDSRLKDEGRNHPELERAAFSLEGPLKGRELTRFVGALLVQCATNGQIDRTELIPTWQNLVPTEWWKWCEVEELVEVCDTRPGTVVKWRGKGDNGPTADRVKAKEAESAPASAPGKRNWHEKFAAQRKR